MEPKIIKSEEQHREYLAEVDRLAGNDPAPGTPEGDRLELLAKLVEDYEKERYAFDVPSPIDAVRFRMEEQGLRQKDLADILGGKNRASEVLAGKRALTLQMIRALSESLKIPAELLIREVEPSASSEDIAVDDIPVRLLVKSGWFEGDEASYLSTSAIVQRYLKPKHGPLYLKRTITYGATPDTNKTRLRLWVSKVREIAKNSQRARGPWHTGTLNEQFLSYVAHLSWSDQGPRMAKEFLEEKGIAFVVLPALPQTKLDGAAMLDERGAPIIGITLRNDRLDSFWFTVVHELAHAWKHLVERDIAITDEQLEDRDDDDAKEAEANRIARDILIPRPIWKRSEAFLRPSAENIYALADRLHISPAIVAGRLRREKTGYTAFGKFLGNRQVRKMFPEVKWAVV
ncbi:MAG TPA: ImmA/IrrE family metallo-endopeptidase [Burkholderiales bacterium]|nr:ImmA/IrrE family metallo-endopeptidase [Burkholderiales bacterium]